MGALNRIASGLFNEHVVFAALLVPTAVVLVAATLSLARLDVSAPSIMPTASYEEEVFL